MNVIREPQAKPKEKLYKVNDRDRFYVGVTAVGSISFRYNYSMSRLCRNRSTSWLAPTGRSRPQPGGHRGSNKDDQAGLLIKPRYQSQSSEI
ncbi:MAG TPA: hypothetical protein DEU90_18560 [Enterobacter asburiae]|nr:hypothetical protein [Enterobacter asburiae]HCF69516.1 hypothetical protein [Enterobacter asburiae]